MNPIVSAQLPVEADGGGRSIFSATGDVAAQLTPGLLSSNDASPISQRQQGGGDGSVGHLSIEMATQRPGRAGLLHGAPVALSNGIWTICLLTLISVISTALYKPASGVVFGHNKLAYYLALAAILAAGLGEATTAFWLSRPGGGSGRRLTFGKVVLFASVFPFAAALGIAGYGFIAG